MAPPNFPTSLDSLANPTPTTLRNAPGFSLSAQVSMLNDIVEALEAKLGIGASTPAAPGVLRRTGAGSSAWGQVASGDLDPSFLLPSGSGFRKLADTTLGAATSVVDFPNISQAYSHLLVVGEALNGSGVSNIFLRFSWDGTTYDAGALYDYVYVNAGNAIVSTGTTITDGGILVGSATTVAYAQFVCDIPLYCLGNLYRQVFSRTLTVSAQTAAGYVFTQTVGQHRSTFTPIRGLRLYASAGTIAAGSRFIVYGLPAVLG